MVTLNPDKLKQYRISPEEAIAAVSKASLIMPSGNMWTGKIERIARTNATLGGNLSQLLSTPIRPVSGTSVYLQHQCKPPWLEPVKLTVVPTRSQGLKRGELDAIFGRFKCPRLLTVELALDFGEGSEADRSFVLRRGLFGMAKPVFED